MALRLPCPCGQEIVLPVEAAGTQTRCPGCGQVVSVPAMGKSVNPVRKKLATPVPLTRQASPRHSPASEPGSNVWALAAVGSSVCVVLVLFIVLAAICFSDPAQETQVTEPVALALPAPPVVEAPVTMPGQTREEPARVRPAIAPVTERRTEKLEPQRQEAPVIVRKGKFVPDRNFIIPLETLTVEEVKIPYKVRRLQLPENKQPDKLRLAVSPAGSDDIAQVLRAMNLPFTDIPAESLNNLDRLREFNVLFLNCGGGWSAGAPRNVRKFVEMGGTLYASDLQYENVRQTFPEVRGPDYPFFGTQQQLKATVTDAGLSDYLGTREIMLHFNSGGWKAAFFAKDRVATYLQGEPTNTLLTKTFQMPKTPVKGKLKKTPNPQPAAGLTPRVVPLLVKFRCQSGSVIYTSFHTSANLSELEKKLLQYLVFSAVNAKAESQVASIMVEAGFAPQNLRNDQVSVSQPGPTQSLEHPGGGLQFAVGFENLGARLKLLVTAPNGQKIEHEENGMFLVEIPSAPPGTWSYTVTAQAVPFANFPIVLAVGKTK